MDELDKKIKHILTVFKKRGPGMQKNLCHEEDLLVSYADGALQGSVKEGIEHHLAECDRCLDLVILYNRVKMSQAHEPAPEVPDALISKAMDLVSEKTGEGLFDIVLRFTKETVDIIKNAGHFMIPPEAAPALLRGKSDSIPGNHIILNRDFPEADTKIEIERTGEENVNIRVFTADPDSGRPLNNLRVSLFNSGNEIASFLTADGAVCFTDICFGRYVIKITSHDKKLGQMSMDLIHSGNGEEHER